MSNEAPPSKKPWLSKTVILNTVALIATFIPPVGEWLKANPVELVAALAAVNVILRFVTSGKISLGWDSSSAGGGASSLPLMLLSCMALGVIGFSLSACSSLPAGTSASIYYLDSNSGAKGGLTFLDGKGSASLNVPMLDADGRQIGSARVVVPITVEPSK